MNLKHRSEWLCRGSISYPDYWLQSSSKALVKIKE